MINLATVEELARNLPVKQREILAVRLMDSLPAPIDGDEDEHSLAEAVQRDAEMDANPSMAVSLEEVTADFPGHL